LIKIDGDGVLGGNTMLNYKNGLMVAALAAILGSATSADAYSRSELKRYATDATPSTPQAQIQTPQGGISPVVVGQPWAVTFPVHNAPQGAICEASEPIGGLIGIMKDDECVVGAGKVELSGVGERVSPGETYDLRVKVKDGERVITERDFQLTTVADLSTVPATATFCEDVSNPGYLRKCIEYLVSGLGADHADHHQAFSDGLVDDLRKFQADQTTHNLQHDAMQASVERLLKDSNLTKEVRQALEYDQVSADDLKQAKDKACTAASDAFSAFLTMQADVKVNGGETSIREKIIALSALHTEPAERAVALESVASEYQSKEQDAARKANGLLIACRSQTAAYDKAVEKLKQDRSELIAKNLLREGGVSLSALVGYTHANAHLATAAAEVCVVQGVTVCGRYGATSGMVAGGSHRRTEDLASAGQWEAIGSGYQGRTAVSGTRTSASTQRHFGELRLMRDLLPQSRWDFNVGAKGGVYFGDDSVATDKTRTTVTRDAAGNLVGQPHLVRTAPEDRKPRSNPFHKLVYGPALQFAVDTGYGKVILDTSVAIDVRNTGVAPALGLGFGKQF
jgi:hypothetical protein